MFANRHRRQKHDVQSRQHLIRMKTKSIQKTSKTFTIVTNLRSLDSLAPITGGGFNKFWSLTVKFGIGRYCTRGKFNSRFVLGTTSAGRPGLGCREQYASIAFTEKLKKTKFSTKLRRKDFLKLRFWLENFTVLSKKKNLK